MKRNLLIVHLILILLLGACQSTPNKAAEPTAAVDAPAPTKAPEATATPIPVANAYAPPVDPYAAPGVDAAAPEGNTHGSLFPLAAGDEGKENSKFFVDSVELKPASAANYTDVVVNGNLPTPCNELKVNVTAPDNQNKIVIQVYTLIEKGKVCTEQLKPFSGPVASLGGYPAGKYTVIVNDQTAGEFTIK